MSIETEEIQFQSELIPLEQREHPCQNITDHLRCRHHTRIVHRYVHFYLYLEGDETFNDRILSIKGEFILYKIASNGNRVQIYREILKKLDTVFTTVEFAINDNLARIKLDYSITILVDRKPNVVPRYEDVFVKSEINDTPLEIQGKTIYVNKACLSLFSDYFRCLFSKDYIDHKLAMIQCELGTLDEVGMLLCTFYPPHIKPISDPKVEQLLELAIRFQVPSVIEKIDHHLAYSSKINIVKKVWIAEKFQLKLVIDNVFEREFKFPLLQAVKRDPYYPRLSDEVKRRFERNQF